MRIIKRGEEEATTERKLRPVVISSQSTTPTSNDTTGVPFVPAYDLLEQKEHELSSEEIIAVALALHELTGAANDSESTIGGWSNSARLDSVSRRLIEGRVR